MMLSVALMENADIFGEAKWIGPSGDNLPCYPDYLPVYKIKCDAAIPHNGSGSIIFGMNDPRLMNRNMNIFNLENQPDSSFVRVEFIGDGKINVYRKGYHPEDVGEIPIASFDTELRQDFNHIEIASNLGHLDFFVNDKKIGYVGINPIGSGGDYLAFPVLAEMALHIPVDSKTVFKNIKVCNYRDPGNTLHSIPETITKSSRISMPVRSMPEVKTIVKIPLNKKIDKATINCSARGIYDLYVNGNRVNTTRIDY